MKLPLMGCRPWLNTIAAVTMAVGVGETAVAAQPEAWGLGLQEPVSPVMRDIYSFHNNLLLPIITAIVVFVLALMLYVVLRFNKRRNPQPSRTTHNTLIEVAWTAIPVIILVIIAVPSFKLLYKEGVAPDSEITLKVIGNQWYWTYEYPDNGNFTFDSNMLERSELPSDSQWLLAVDNKVMLPVDTNVRLIFTANDVLHSWTIPAFGVKMDSVPGRLNESWVRVEREGTYFGQCSEICGVRHAFMPIAVEAVSKEAFAAWVAEAQAKFAKVDGTGVALARTDSAR